LKGKIGERETKKHFKYQISKCKYQNLNGMAYGKALWMVEIKALNIIIGNCRIRTDIKND
jgi:hypothetical protein